MFPGIELPNGERCHHQKHCEHGKLPHRSKRGRFGGRGFVRGIRASRSFWAGVSLRGVFRTGSRRCIGNFDLREEAVAATSNGFHKARTLGGVPQGLTDFVDGFVEPVVEIHESVRRPEFFLKFLASYDLAGMLKQRGQDLEGLFLKANPQAALA
jgi:hypothetical protein